MTTREFINDSAYPKLVDGTLLIRCQWCHSLDHPSHLRLHVIPRVGSEVICERCINMDVGEVLGATFHLIPEDSMTSRDKARYV